MKNLPLRIGIIAIVVIAVGALLNVQLHRTRNSANNQKTKPQVVASFYPLYYFTQAIAGDRADVYNLTPPGAEPHEYELTPGDAERLASSQLVVANGQLEPWLPRIESNLKKEGVQVVKVSDGLSTKTYTDEEGEQTFDPHTWLSPKLAKIIVEHITESLIAMEPVYRDEFLARSTTLQQRLTDLDGHYRQGLQTCEQHQFITAHAAFGYLAADYQLTQIGISGLSPEIAPTPRELADLIDFAKKNKVTHIFFETLASPKLSELIAREVGAITMVLNPIEGLTDQEVSSGKTYFTEMEQNLSNLRTGLHCQ